MFNKNGNNYGKRGTGQDGIKETTSQLKTFLSLLLENKRSGRLLLLARAQ